MSNFELDGVLQLTVTSLLVLATARLICKISFSSIRIYKFVTQLQRYVWAIYISCRFWIYQSGTLALKLMRDAAMYACE